MRTQPRKRRPNGKRGPGKSPKHREADTVALINFPGIDLAKLYRGVVEQSRTVAGKVNDPEYHLSVELLDKCTAKLLATELAKESPNADMVCRLQRGIHGATRDRVARYVAESTLGAAALAVDGVNRLLQLRGELKAEKTSGQTIDNVSE